MNTLNKMSARIRLIPAGTPLHITVATLNELATDLPAPHRPTEFETLSERHRQAAAALAESTDDDMDAAMAGVAIVEREVMKTLTDDPYLLQQQVRMAREFAEDPDLGGLSDLLLVLAAAVERSGCRDLAA